jgi:hypothetical protein
MYFLIEDIERFGQVSILGWQQFQQCTFNSQE